MNNFLLIAQMRFWTIRNILRNLQQESLLKIAVIVSFLSAFWIGIFFFFYKGLNYILLFPGVGPLLVQRVLALYLAAVFFMLIISAAITSFSAHYRSPEVEFLFSFPIAYDQTFVYKFVESLILCSWAVIFLLLPLLVAYGLLHNLAKSFYLLSVISFLPFIFIAVIAGSAITLFLVRFFPKRHSARVAVFGLILLLFLAYYLWPKKEFGSPESMGTSYIFNLMLKHTSLFQWPFLPNYWLSEGILSLAKHNFRRFTFFFLLLVSNFLFLGQLLTWCAQRFYYPGWEGLKKSSASSRLYFSKCLALLVERGLGCLRIPVRAIVTKDLKTFLRDSAQWLQFSIFFGLIAVYILNLRTLPYNLELSFWKNLITFLNLGAISLTMAMLNLRFIFPLLSLEGKRFWIIGTTPLGMKDILWEKFGLSFLGSLVITEGLIILSCVMLRVPMHLFWLSLGVVLCLCFGICGLSVGMGAIYPNFKEDNPAAIISGFAGTLLFVLSLLYITAVISAVALPIHWYSSGQIASSALTGLVSIVVAGIILLSLTVCIVPMKLGLRRLQGMEF